MSDQSPWLCSSVLNHRKNENCNLPLFILKSGTLVCQRCDKPPREYTPK